MEKTTTAELTKKEKLQNMEDTRQRLIIDKLYVLKALLVGAMIDSEKTVMSEPVYRPLIESITDEDIIRDKIMDLVKQC